MSWRSIMILTRVGLIVTRSALHIVSVWLARAATLWVKGIHPCSTRPEGKRSQNVLAELTYYVIIKEKGLDICVRRQWKMLSSLVHVERVQEENFWASFAHAESNLPIPNPLKTMQLPPLVLKGREFLPRLTFWLNFPKHVFVVCWSTHNCSVPLDVIGHDFNEETGRLLNKGKTNLLHESVSPIASGLRPPNNVRHRKISTIIQFRSIRRHAKYAHGKGGNARISPRSWTQLSFLRTISVHLGCIYCCSRTCHRQDPTLLSRTLPAAARSHPSANRR